MTIRLPWASRRGTAWLGLGTIGAIVAGCLAAALTYTGPAGEPFSPLNHNISELGYPGASPWGWAFNAGLILGGLFYAAFGRGLGCCLAQRPAHLASRSSMTSGFACVLVGVFPTDHPRAHIPAAMLFFYAGLLAVVIFTLLALKRPRVILSPGSPPAWLALPGLLSIISQVAYLTIPMALYRRAGYLLGPQVIHRPRVWLGSALEWLVFTTVLLWIGCVSFWLACSSRSAAMSIVH